MGRPGAFLDIARVEHGERPRSETIGDFNEFALPLDEKSQQLQASRCMYCGVAFCQSGVCFGHARTSGCPLHNLIPEWNDLVCRGLWDQAADRMALTNPFPEFTGRICPALCEQACNLGLNDEPTTIRDNERAISDHAWASGHYKPYPKPAPDAFRVAIVGSGPSGLAVADTLARAGVACEVFERSEAPGGLLMYGIPNMKLPKEVVQRRIALLEASGTTFTCNTDATQPATLKRLTSEFDAVVIASGASAERALQVPGSDAKGVVFALDYLHAATAALLEGTPSAIDAAGLDVVVIGGGDTGTDCVATALRQGAKTVRQLEFMPAPPTQRQPNNAWPEWPNVLKTDYGQLEAALVQDHDPRSFARDTTQVLTRDGHVYGLKVATLDWSSGRPERISGSEEELPAQLVLLAMGFTGPERALYDALHCDIQEARGGYRPALIDNSHRVQSSSDLPIFATGDARTGSSLVVSAISDGLACAAEVLAALRS